MHGCGQTSLYYFLILCAVCLFAVTVPASRTSAAPVFFEETESWQPNSSTADAIDSAHQRIQKATGKNVCFILGQYNFQNAENYKSLDQGRCDGFLFIMESRMEYQTREFDYEFIGMGYDAHDDAWPSHYELAEMDFVQGPRPNDFQAKRVDAFANRFIQATNSPTVYWFREVYEEATEEYVLQVVINYSLAMTLGLVPVLLYLVYRILTASLSISWKWHFLAAVLVPLILLFIYLPILNSFHKPMETTAYAFMPVLGLAYAFCAFLATFFLGQRITGNSDWPPYWAIALIYILAPLAILAAGAARNAVGSMGSSRGGSGGKGSGQSFKGSGGTFGGGGASGSW